MKNFILKFSDLLFYSNFFIAVCAASLAYQTLFLFKQIVWPEPLVLFVFFATLLLYSLHRIIGFTILDKSISTRRIRIISKFKRHIHLYIVLASAGVLITLYFLPIQIWFLLFVPALISIIYITPAFKNKKRFRDLPFVKVFAVGLVWTWVCVWMPLKYLEVGNSVATYLLLLEKLLFIIAITIPFDIRDRAVDSRNKTKTLPIIFGVRASKNVSYFFISIALSSVWVNHLLGLYPASISWALSICYFLTIAVIYRLQENSHDYWYSAVLDGTIPLQLILIVIASSF